MLTPDEVIADAWDDDLHRFGAEEYVMARYLTSPATMPMNEGALAHLPAGAFLSPAHSLVGSRFGRASPSQPAVPGQGNPILMGWPPKD